MIVIIGAGISGLTAANFLEKEFTLLEKNNYTGGLATQYRAGGYSFDFAGHYFHFLDKQEIWEIVRRFCAFRKFNRVSKTFAADRLVPYPFQYHLSYLPVSTRKEILNEVSRNSSSDSDNLHDYLKNQFGNTLFELFFKPFLGKYYGVDLQELASRMDKGSIPPPDKERMAAGAAGKKFINAGYNPVFYYPATSLEYFIRQYTRGIDGSSIHLEEEVVEVDVREKVVKTNHGSYRYDKLINTMPLKELLRIIKPGGILPSRDTLSHTSTLVVNTILKRKRKRFHWVYIADQKIPFYRAGYYPVHPYPACYLEKTVSPGFVPDLGRLREEVAFTLQKLGMIEGRDEIVFVDVRVIPVSYVLFTRNWRDVVPPLLEKLKDYGIYSVGRYGSWNYTSMSDDIKSALHTARELNRQ